MSSKWNETLVTSFLHAYKRHPCLWNPYHKDYYNCREKNEALQKIIDDLDTPGLTVIDYLQQIKGIREKYKREQTRTIEGLQSQKRYKSPFPWYNLVADMLTKVINDEEKVNSETPSKTGENVLPVLRSLSNDNIRDWRRKKTSGPGSKIAKIQPCNDSSCDEVAKRRKSTEKSSRSSIKRKVTVSTTDQPRTRYVTCPGTRTKENVSKNLEEDVLSNSRPTRDTESTAIGYPCASSNDFARRNTERSFEPPFLRCPLCGWEDAKDKQVEGENVEKPMREQKHFIPTSEYATDLFPLSKGALRRLTDTTRYNNHSGDFEISRESVKRVPCPGVTKKLVETPVKSTHDQSSSMEHLQSRSKKDVNALDEPTKESKKSANSQMTGDTPIHTQIVQFDPVVTSKFHCGTIEASAHLKIVLSNSNGDKDGKPRSSQVDQKDAKSNESLSKGTQFSTDSDLPKSKLIETSYTDRETQSTVCEKGRCVSLQTIDPFNDQDKRRTRDSTGSTESKEVAVNMVEQTTKGVQATICVSRGHLARSPPVENEMKETGTATHVPLSGSKTTVDTEPQVEPEVVTPCDKDSCPRNVSEILALQQLIRKMFVPQAMKSLSSTSLKAQNSRECRVKGNCTIDVTEMINNIKELAFKTLDQNVENFPKHELKEFCARLKKDVTDAYSQDAEIKRSFAEAGTSKRVDSLNISTMTDKENDSRRIGVSEENKEFLLEEKEKPSLVDKEVSTSSGNREVGTSNSSARVQAISEVAIQSSSPHFPNYSVCTNKRKKISTGTQKRDPILVRVIKCYENQATVKSDKGTFTVDSEELAKKFVDKRIETCRRSTCRPYSAFRKSNAVNEQLAFQGHAVEISEPKRTFAYENYTCDKSCKNKDVCDVSDWTDVRNVGALYSPNKCKIPICVRPRKCIYAKKQVAESYAN